MQTVAAPRRVQRLQQVAQEYRARGYEVVVGPERHQLPESLAPYQPDLLARKGNETVLVEIKSWASPAQGPKLEDLARAVRAQPGWRFDVVLTDPEALRLPDGGAQAWDENDVAHGLAEVDALLQAGHTEAALLLAWSATEATLRLLAGREGIDLERHDPPYLLKLLATSAAITREEYHTLWDAMRLRNAVAHGLKPARLDPAQVRDLADLTSRLLQADAAAEAAGPADDGVAPSPR